MQDTVGHAADDDIVGDHYCRGRELTIDTHNRLQDQAPGLMIEGTGGFIAKQEFRPLDYGTRNGHPLLLPAGELCGKVIEPLGKPHPREGFLRLHRGCWRFP